MFQLLPLLEYTMGADGISDITKNIIDDEIFLFTESAMETLVLVGNLPHTSRYGNDFRRLKNPFSNKVLSPHSQLMSI